MSVQVSLSVLIPLSPPHYRSLLSGSENSGQSKEDYRPWSPPLTPSQEEHALQFKGLGDGNLISLLLILTLILGMSVLGEIKTAPNCSNGESWDDIMSTLYLIGVPLHVEWCDNSMEDTPYLMAAFAITLGNWILNPNIVRFLPPQCHK